MSAKPSSMRSNVPHGKVKGEPGLQGRNHLCSVLGKGGQLAMAGIEGSEVEMGCQEKRSWSQSNCTVIEFEI